MILPGRAGRRSSSIPSNPVAQAAFGLIAYGGRELIKVPLRFVTLPVKGLHRTLIMSESIRHGYGQLAERGIGIVTLLTGPSHRREDGLDEDVDVATLRQAAEGWLDYADEDIAGTAAASATTVTPLVDLGDMAGDPAPVTDPAMGGFAGSTLDPTAGSPSQPAAEPDERPVDIVTRAAEAAEAAAAEPDSPSIDRSELPILDFDHVTAGSLRGRLRRLEIEDLRTLRAYEQEHGRRLPILTLLENRIAKLEAVGSA